MMRASGNWAMSLTLRTRFRARSLEQAQASLLIGRVDALHIADLASLPVLPADGFA